ncbi:MAG: FkbM family methyltransferase [Alphaproteobacteria bacterium]|nr:FkbM family methyltransferase [Alphaproteobacteria bacterium]
MADEALPSAPQRPGEGAPADLKQALAQAYIEMVQLHRAGDAARARAVGARVQAELGGLLESKYREARAHAAAGRRAPALWAYAEALELHRLNLARLALPVSIAACYEGLRALYQAEGQATGVAAAARLAARNGASFYAHPHACQIPVLGGLYELMFGERADGTFVEVGAYDGETYSNTSTLADLGWRGLYLEPVPGSCARCRQRHARNPKVSVIECAIGAADGTATIWQHGPCSTMSEAEHALNLREGMILDPEVRRIEVAVRRLDGVLAEAAIAPGFELLVVDVDGAEEAVFAGFDLQRWRPRYLLIELVEDSPHFADSPDLIAAARRVREHIAGHGYHEIYRDVANTIFATQ